MVRSLFSSQLPFRWPCITDEQRPPRRRDGRQLPDGDRKQHRWRNCRQGRIRNPTLKSISVNQGRAATGEDISWCKQGCKQQAGPDWPGPYAFRKPLNYLVLIDWALTGLEPVTPSVSKCTETRPPKSLFPSFPGLFSDNTRRNGRLQGRAEIAGNCGVLRSCREPVGNFLGTAGGRRKGSRKGRTRPAPLPWPDVAVRRRSLRRTRGDAEGRGRGSQGMAAAGGLGKRPHRAFLFFPLAHHQ